MEMFRQNIVPTMSEHFLVNWSLSNFSISMTWVIYAVDKKPDTSRKHDCPIWMKG
jgi:hypothetical protein